MVALLGGLLFAGTARGGQGKFSIILPANDSLAEGRLIAVVARAGGGADTLAISVNNKAIVNAPVASGKGGFVCKTVSLGFGPNEIVVSALSGGKAVRSGKVTVFYRSDISRRFNIAPSRFHAAPFHEGKNEGLCSRCHDLTVNKKTLNPSGPSDSICYPCHKELTKFSHVHGPAAVWACLACHKQNSEPVSYETPQPDKALCRTCHSAEIKKWTARKYWHGPTSTGKCTICHNPHASNNDFWLRKPTWYLCTGCHAHKASGEHVLASFVLGKGGHPTKGYPDPMHPGMMLTCASCHNPHASNARYLFNYGATSIFGLCVTCHPSP